jgi:hypothetical protein
MKTVTDEAVELVMQKELVERKISEVIFFKRDSQSWTDYHNTIMEDIINNGYVPKDNHPIISKDNIVMDGNHRLVILQELYGDDYVVKFRLVNYNYNNLIVIGNLVKIWVNIKRVFRRKNK